MANKQLFQSIRGRLIRKPDTLNHEFAPAYALSPEAALAQYAATGCLNSTFYASSGEQLDTVLGFCDRLDPEFIAKTAVYCREKGAMKDMPALLCAVLTVKDQDKLYKVFDRVIDNGKMLRNFVQIMRSGVIGRKSLGTVPKRLVRTWLDKRSDEAVFRNSVGNNPSMADIIKMVHPKPVTASREALYGYLIGREVSKEALPETVRRFEAFKADRQGPVPNVPFQMLTSLDLGQREWTEIARNAGWHMTRMNLNTFGRHGVFKGSEITEIIARRLSDPAEIEKARVFPYQLMMAHRQAAGTAPGIIGDALQDAMEIAVRNVPAFKGNVVVCPDVSGSMTWASVTGSRKGSTSKVRCIDVAALVSTAIVRKNPRARVIPFETGVVPVRINPRDSIMTNTDKIACIGGGGTNCSAPLALLNKERAKTDLVVFVSDNESWVDARHGSGTEMMRQWNILKKRNPGARLVCLDIQPYGTTQAYDREDILNIGGFSDQVFEVIARFAEGKLMNGHWADVIRSTEI